MTTRRSVFGNSIALRQVQGKDGDIGKDVPAIIQRKFQGFRKHGDDHVELALAVLDAQLLDQKFPVIGARIPPQIHGLEILILAGYPAGLQRVRESFVGSQENGCVRFVGMQDQDVLSTQVNGRL